MENNRRPTLKNILFRSSFVLALGFGGAGLASCHLEPSKCYSFSAMYDPTPKTPNDGDEFLYEGGQCVPFGTAQNKESCPTEVTRLGFGAGMIEERGTIVLGTCKINGNLQP